MIGGNMVIGNREVSGGHLVLLIMGGIFLAVATGLIIVALWKGVSFGLLSTFGIVLTGEASETLARDEAREEIADENMSRLEGGYDG